MKFSSIVPAPLPSPPPNKWHWFIIVHLDDQGVSQEGTNRRTLIIIEFKRRSAARGLVGNFKIFEPAKKEFQIETTPSVLTNDKSIFYFYEFRSTNAHLVREIIIARFCTCKIANLSRL